MVHQRDASGGRSMTSLRRIHSSGSTIAGNSESDQIGSLTVSLGETRNADHAGLMIAGLRSKGPGEAAGDAGAPRPGAHRLRGYPRRRTRSNNEFTGG